MDREGASKRRHDDASSTNVAITVRVRLFPNANAAALPGEGRRRVGPIWGEPRSGPLAGGHAGKDAVFGVVGLLAEITAGMFGQEIHDLLANDEHAVVLVEQQWEQPHPFRGNGVHVWHMNNGIATEAWVMVLDQRAADAALTA